jgi:hypothetical protein
MWDIGLASLRPRYSWRADSAGFGELVSTSAVCWSVAGGLSNAIGAWAPENGATMMVDVAKTIMAKSGRRHLVIVFGDEFEFRLKRVIKSVDVIKVLAAIGITLAHLFDSNQIVNQFAKITGRVDSPVG